MAKTKHRKDHSKRLAEYKANLKPEGPVQTPFSRKKKDHLLQGFQAAVDQAMPLRGNRPSIILMEAPPEGSQVQISSQWPVGEVQAFVDGKEVEIEK